MPKCWKGVAPNETLPSTAAPACTGDDRTCAPATDTNPPETPTAVGPPPAAAQDEIAHDEPSAVPSKLSVTVWPASCSSPPETDVTCTPVRLPAPKSAAVVWVQLTVVPEDDAGTKTTSTQ